MAKHKQAKGMEHIRNLKKQAKLMFRECNSIRSMWPDCIRAAMLQHHLDCIKDEKENFNYESIINPS